ncbi:ATP-binding protein [Aliikangiella sp. IMCC44359]|uniref:ATP-binding protein n=1 Tax=Aliikangiella sp. IMCC44359 TaxID=3459125 RepID=UPI00403A897D
MELNQTMLEAASKNINSYHNSVQRFLIIVMIASIALPAMLSGSIFIYYHYQATVNEEQVKRADSYIELLEAGMQIPLWELNMELAQPLIDAISVDSSVRKITIWDIQDTFLQYSNNVYQADASDLVLQKPVIYQSTPIGKVELIYSLQEVKNKAFIESKTITIIVLVQLLFSLLLFHYFLNKRVTKPLTMLENSAKRMANGDLTSNIPKLENDEFGSLSVQLEIMRQALEEVFNTLTEKVSDRTKKYNRTNNELLNVVDRLEETQKNLIQYEKLASLGALVSGVSHQLKSPINSGLMVATSLQNKTQKFIQSTSLGITEDDLNNYLKEMLKGSQTIHLTLRRASELLQSFKQISIDRSIENQQEFFLHDIIQETLDTLTPNFKNTEIEIQNNVAEDIQLWSYPGPLGQALMSLINNAQLHAFTNENETRTPTIKISCLQIEDWICIEISDNGRGIESHKLAKVFDPFYTTNFDSSGMGLGLHIAHNIVTGLLGGRIEVESTVNIGTTFMLHIPKSPPVDQ